MTNIPLVCEGDTALGIPDARDTLPTLSREVRCDAELLRDFVSSLGYP